MAYDASQNSRTKRYTEHILEYVLLNVAHTMAYEASQNSRTKRYIEHILEYVLLSVEHIYTPWHTTRAKTAELNDT